MPDSKRFADCVTLTPQKYTGGSFGYFYFYYRSHGRVRATLLPV